MGHGQAQGKGTGEDRFYWEGVANGQLLFQRCTACNAVQFPPRHQCATCWSDDLEVIESSGRGTIESLTVVRRAPLPAFRDRTPYAIAAIRVAEGPRMITNLIGDGALQARIGDAVGVAFEAGPDGIILPQFTLAPV